MSFLKNSSFIPIFESVSSILLGHNNFWETAYSWDFNKRSLHLVLVIILVQFLNEFLLLTNDKGIRPNSSKTPLFLVCFCTPSNCLQKDKKSVSIGLCFGSGNIPQKSLA